MASKKEKLICKLCKENVANQSGSHIFSHFLIKSAINKEGVKSRDTELTFKISASGFNEAYIGRRINEEDIIATFGDTVDNIKLKEDNPFTIDYMICMTCEKKIKILEDYFAVNVLMPFLEKKIEIINENMMATFSINNLSASMIRLFIYSLAWRASVSKFGEFTLGEIRENKLHKLLKSNVGDSLTLTFENINNNFKEINRFPLAITFFETNPNRLSQNLIFIHPFSEIPYLFILNNMSFCLFFKKRHIKNKSNSLKRINYNVDLDRIMNIDEQKMTFGFAENKEREFLLKGLNHLVAQGKKKSLSELFKYFHSKLLGFPPSRDLINFYLYKIAHDDFYIGVKYSENHVIDFSLRFFNELVGAKPNSDN